MPKKTPHDLHDFMQQISVEISSEYNRIQKRATEDPGTAGDQGEENWATLLRGWLPQTYHVVTKGRIINEEGIASPQIDVIILKSIYPQRLLDKKLYLAAGVAAVFECKTTLKRAHIGQAMEKCVLIKNLYKIRTGTPYKELHAPVVFGILAHSHVWKGRRSTPISNIEKNLHESVRQHVSHPRLQVDLVCVADLATWTSAKMTFMGPALLRRSGITIPPSEITELMVMHLIGLSQSLYMQHNLNFSQVGRRCERCGSWLASAPQVDHFTPIGVLISYLLQKLAWEDPALRDLADYYRIANISGPAGGDGRYWDSGIYSEKIRPRVEQGMLSSGIPWDEWRSLFV